MTAGGVAEGDGARKIQVMCFGDDAKVAGTGSDVLTGAGPAAAWVADGAKFQIPGGDSSGAQRFAKMAHVGQIELIAPKASVEDESDPVAAARVGDAEFTELARFGAVKKLGVSLRCGACEDIARIQDLFRTN